MNVLQPAAGASAFDRLIQRLRERGCHPKQRGDKAEALCPAHDDTTPSLSVARESDRVLIHCHAGCATDAVVKALDVTEADLFDKPFSREPPRAKPDREHTYVDEKGEPLFISRRCNGNWNVTLPDGTPGLNGEPWVLYRLPEVLDAVKQGRRIWIVEGEKDADALARAGEVGTTNPFGALKWRDEFSKVLRGAEVVVVADKDTIGRRHAARVAASLKNVASSVRVVEAKTGKDAADHLGAGLGIEEFLPCDPQDTSANNVIVLPTVGHENRPDVAGDHLNAQRFLEEHGGTVHYAPELSRWYIWNGAWWEEDRLNRIRELAAQTIDNLRQWVAEARGDEHRRRANHYQASSKAGRIDGLLSLVATDLKVVVGVNELDNRPLLLPCRNGTVDLRTGKLSPANPADLLTRGVNVDYEPEARSDQWESFLNQIFASNVELIRYVQRLLGYCSTGVVYEHVLPILYGQGANGKSTFIGVIQDLLGDYAITAPTGLVIRHNHEPHPERIAALRGRRMVVSSELEERAVLAEQVVKMLTGGDALSGRELYSRRFTFGPTHKILLVTNHRPKVSGVDPAMWRRIQLVPFGVTVPPEEQDRTLRPRLLRDHSSAVLAWLVKGCVDWYEHGLGGAQVVVQATRDYRASEDVIGSFLAERTCDMAGKRTKVGDLYTVWSEWCGAAGERPGRMQALSTALENRGFEVETYQRVKYVRGLVLRGDENGEGS